MGLHTGLLGPWGVRGEQQICTKTLTGVCSVICSPLEQHSERDSTDKAVPLAPETLGAAGTWQHVANILSATSVANVSGHQVPEVNANLQVSAACSSLQTKIPCAGICLNQNFPSSCPKAWARCSAGASLPTPFQPAPADLPWPSLVPESPATCSRSLWAEMANTALVCLCSPACQTQLCEASSQGRGWH